MLPVRAHPNYLRKRVAFSPGPAADMNPQLPNEIFRPHHNRPRLFVYSSHSFLDQLLQCVLRSRKVEKICWPQESWAERYDEGPLVCIIILAPYPSQSTCLVSIPGHTELSAASSFFLKCLPEAARAYQCVYQRMWSFNIQNTGKASVLGTGLVRDIEPDMLVKVALSRAKIDHFRHFSRPQLRT